MTDKIRAIIADDHPLYRGGVAHTLASQSDIEVVGEAATTAEAIALATSAAPDIALIDISMPGDGQTIIQQLKVLSPDLRIAMLTASEADDDVTCALGNGADGYILKGVGGGELVEIVRSLARGEGYVSPALAGRLLTSRTRTDRGPADPLDSLTHREEEILRKVACGLTNKEIARGLDLQEKTVKHYMTLILQKLGVRNRTEAAMIARDRWSAPAP